MYPCTASQECLAQRGKIFPIVDIGERDRQAIDIVTPTAVSNTKVSDSPWRW